MFQMQARVHWLLHNAETSVKYQWRVHNDPLQPTWTWTVYPDTWSLELVLDTSSLHFDFLEAKRDSWWGWIPDRATAPVPSRAMATMEKPLHIQDAARAPLCQDNPLGWGWEQISWGSGESIPREVWCKQLLWEGETAPKLTEPHWAHQGDKWKGPTPLCLFSLLSLLNPGLRTKKKHNVRGLQQALQEEKF